MNVSQPAMSKRLRSLETVAGAELFERSSRGVTLTPAGVQLYSAARRLLRSADSVQALIKNPAASTPVRIASSPDDRRAAAAAGADATSPSASTDSRRS